jgi:hypothetical protein
MPTARLSRLVRLSQALLALVAGLEMLGWLSLSGPILLGAEPLAGRDFVATFTAAQLVVRGEPERIYDPVRQRQVQAEISGAGWAEWGFLPYVHPAFMLWPALPLAGLPPPVAFAIYMLMASLALGWIFFRLQQRLFRRIALPLLAMATYFPVLIMINHGQTSFLPLAGFALAHGAFSQGRDGLAGSLLALSSAKPQYAFFFPLLLAAKGRWRALRGFGLTLLAFYLAGAALAGWLWPIDYLRITSYEATGSDTIGVHPIAMHNFRGAITGIWPGIDPGLALALSGAASLLGFVFVYRAWPPGWPAGERSWDLAWALSVVMVVLGSPHVNTHDLVLLLVPGALVASRCLPGDDAPRWLALLWACYLAPPLTLLLIIHHPLLRFTVLTAVLLGLALFRELGRTE